MSDVDAAQAFNDAVIAGLPLLWYRFNEAATPVISYGSVASMNGTVTNMGAFQVATGIPATPYAYDFDGATSLIATPTSNSLEAVSWTIGVLMNLDTAGEASAGRVITGLSGASNNVLRILPSTGTQVNVQVFNTANASQTTLATPGIPFGSWTWLFVQFSDATKKVRIWRSVSGALTEYTYDQQPAVTDTPRVMNNAIIGNHAAATMTTDGKIAQFLYYGSLLTTDQMQSIITASGVV